MKGFSASTIKSWFQYGCERKVRYEMSSDTELEAVPVIKTIREQAWATLGNEYETRVLRRLAREVGVLLPASGEKALSETLTAAFLRGKRSETYAAQMNLRPPLPVPFLEGTGLKLNRNLADLVRRTQREDGVHVFTVIDIKATRRATPFHKTQVAFYVRVLEDLLRQMGGQDLNAVEISPIGEIWRIPDHGDASGDEAFPDKFALAPYLRLVDEFCSATLPRIATKSIAPFDETFFHLYFKCEQCSYIDHCSKSVADSLPPENRDVSAVPGLSHESKHALRRLGVRSVGDLAAATGLAKAPGVGWSLSRRAGLLVSRAQALVAGAIKRTEEEHTFLMPGRCDVILALSVDYDPIDDRLAAIGYRRSDGEKVNSDVVAIPMTSAAADEAAAMVEVLGRLIEDLKAIDAHNRAAEARGEEGLYAHIFFYEPSEAVTLQKAVARHLENPAIRNGLLDLVRLFPPEDAVPEPEYRGANHLPATAVRSVVEQLFALPVVVSYDLRQVSAALAQAGGGPAYQPAEPFRRSFSSLLSIEVIRAMRENRKGAPKIAEIEADVRARLSSLVGVIGWLSRAHAQASAQNAPLLRLNKRPFRFQSTFDPLDAADLDILMACELLENRAGMLDALVKLARPRRSRRESGTCLADLRLVRHWAYGNKRVLQFHVPPANADADLGPDDFDLILTDDDPDLRLDPLMWPAFKTRIRAPSPEFAHRRDLLQVEMESSDFAGPSFQRVLSRAPEDGWCIDRVFSDRLTPRAAAFLARLAQEAK